MRVAVTGATGTIGRAVVAELKARGDDVLALSRGASAATRALGVEAVEWRDPKSEPAPGLAGCDAVIHLLGEPIAQRWSESAKREIRESRTLGTRNLVAGLRAADPRPRVLVSQSATGYYGPHGDERVDESAPPGDDFVAGIVVDWESEARAAEELGLRVVRTRTGVVLSPSGGALAQMVPPFKLGVGGPVAGGRQYVPWIHLDDVAGALIHALEGELSGAVNLTAPEPATNAEVSRALGRVLHRPALLPVPAFALRTALGQMSQIVTTGVRAVPAALTADGYGFRQADLDEALRAAID